MEVAVHSIAFIPELLLEFVDFSLPPKIDCRREIGKDGLSQTCQWLENTASTILCSDVKGKRRTIRYDSTKEGLEKVVHHISVDTPHPLRTTHLRF